MIQDKIVQEWMKDFLADPNDAYEPSTIFYYPIADTAADWVNVVENKKNNVVAVFGM